MTTIVTRAGKGSPLTNVEVDANFTNLNNDKIEKTGGTITANSSSAALTITQTGSGNAFVVEDSASPDSTPFVINNMGQVLNGFTVIQAPQNQGLTFGSLRSQVIGADGNSSSSGNFMFSTGSAIAPVLFLAKSSSATVGTHGLLPASYNIGSLSFNASDGTNFVEAASILASVDSTSGTNNMPGRLVFATTSSGSSTPVERMRIDNAGRITTGGISSTLTSFALGGIHPSSGTGARSLHAIQTIPSNVTSYYIGFHSEPVTQAASFALTELSHFKTQPQTFGAGSSVTVQYGFHINSALTGATNNYGFYGNIPAGTGRWNFYAAGTADNYFAGKVGIGIAPVSSTQIYSVHTSTDAVSYGFLSTPSVGSATVTAFRGVQVKPSTQAASFTSSSVSNFYASQGTIGSGSSVTNWSGYIADSSITGATNNYGFYGGIAAGTGRWNFYAAGTADNYFAGSVGIGATPSGKLDVAGSLGTVSINGNGDQVSFSKNGFNYLTATGASATLQIQATGASGTLTFGTNSAERMRIDSSGRVSVGGSAIDGPLHLIDTGAGRDLGGEINSNNAFGFRHEFYKSRGTNSAKTVVVQNDELGVLNFRGYDGSAYKVGAAIRAYSDGAPGAEAMPGRIVFFTTPSGSGTAVERMRIDSAGNVGIGTAPVADSPLHIFSNAGGIKRVVLHNAATTANTAARYDLATGTPNAYSILAQTEDGAGNVSLQLATGVGVNQGIRLAPSVGNVTVNTVAGLGYGAGAGGTVTQATSKSTAVTLVTPKPTGQITMNNAALAAGTSVSFALSNNMIAATDVLLVTAGALGGNYRVEASSVSAGSATIRVTNISAGSLSEALTINFAVIKGSSN